MFLIGKSGTGKATIIKEKIKKYPIKIVNKSSCIIQDFYLLSLNLIKWNQLKIIYDETLVYFLALVLFSYKNYGLRG